MFEDVCIACSRPVDSGRAYCSDECAVQDAMSADSSGLSSANLSPYLAAANTKSARGPMTLTPDGQLPPFVLHNPRPDYPLPLALASPLQGPKRSSKQLHMRKRSSLSSSSTASSALSTPSAPPLTDDDDSMSDPEFTLDPRADPTLLPSMLSYARRPSATNTRSTVVPFVSSSSSTSTSASATGVSKLHAAGSEKDLQQHEDTHSKARRPRHMHHLSVPTVALLDNFDRDRLFYADARGPPRNAEQVRPHSVKYDRHLDYDGESLRSVDVESDYAVLAKSSVATKGAETIREPKSRRAPTRARPRGSLPAYLSLMKLASPSSGGFAGLPPRASPPATASISQRSSHNAHKTSPTVAHSHTSSSTATLSASFAPASVRATTTSAAIAQSLRVARSPHVSESSPSHGNRAGSPGSANSAGTRCISLRSRTVPIAATSPKAVAVSQHAKPPISGARALVPDTLCECDGGCSGTPRGRTRSRSDRTRSRSRSRTRERARRAHLGGSPQDGARGMHMAGLGMTAVQRGRPHVRGMGARGRRARRTGTDDAEESAAGERPRGAVEIDWLDVRETEDAEVGPEPARERRRVPLRA